MVVAHFHSIGLEAVVTNETSFIHLWNDGWHDFKCTKTNREQAKIDFIQGDPKAVIMMEVASYVGMEDAESKRMLW
jgi:hypothetical protein